MLKIIIKYFAILALAIFALFSGGTLGANIGGNFGFFRIGTNHGWEAGFVFFAVLFWVLAWYFGHLLFSFLFKQKPEINAWLLFLLAIVLTSVILALIHFTEHDFSPWEFFALGLSPALLFSFLFNWKNKK